MTRYIGVLCAKKGESVSSLFSLGFGSLFFGAGKTVLVVDANFTSPLLELSLYPSSHYAHDTGLSVVPSSVVVDRIRRVRQVIEGTLLEDGVRIKTTLDRLVRVERSF